MSWIGRALLRLAILLLVLLLLVPLLHREELAFLFAFGPATALGVWFYQSRKNWGHWYYLLSPLAVIAWLLFAGWVITLLESAG